MALSPRTTGVTNPGAVVFAAVSGRVPNVLSIQVVNPSGGNVIVDFYDGSSAGAILDTVSVGPFATTVKHWNFKQRLGLLKATAGNAIFAQTRSPVSGGVEVLLESGRV